MLEKQKYFLKNGEIEIFLKNGNVGEREIFLKNGNGEIEI